VTTSNLLCMHKTIAIRNPYVENIALIAAAFLVILVVPTVSSAQTQNFEIAAWVPYWKSSEGVASITPQLSIFNEVNPFVYTVKLNGSLNQASSITGSEWVSLKQAAKNQNVRFIPTITWANADAMDEIFRDPEKRRTHVRAIVSEVYANGFDGIDIDYEGKYARTREHFSLFLKDLEEAMGYDKWIMCTIEARTPLTSRYSTPESIPADIEYSNDFKDINTYCDRVRIMAYDQGRFDLRLNESNQHPYIPVADTAWVEKVMRLAMEDIDASKIVIGVPTYGYEYDMFVDAQGKTQYSRLWSFNPGYATEVAQKLNLTPQRNSAGELFLTYPASQSPDPIIPLPNATRVMSWSDSGAIAEKIDLAKRLGLNGVAVFKIDGGQDAGVLPVLAKARAEMPKDSVGTIPPIISTPIPTAPSSQVSVSVPTSNLYLGKRGEDVRDLQKLLNAYGFVVSQSGAGSSGNETAFFGQATKASLIRFQKSHAISPAVGYYGPITRKTMLSL